MPIDPIMIKLASELIILTANVFRGIGQGAAADKIEAEGKEALKNYGTVKDWSRR
jgi:hypothetical protein